MDLPGRCLLVLALALAPAVASAQAPTAPAPGPGGGGGAPAATGGGGAASAAPGVAGQGGQGGQGAQGGGAVAPGGSAAPPPKPVVPAAGYAYSDKPAAGRAPVRARVVRSASGPVATLPGFEETSDGGSRLFVQLTQSVPVEERKASGSITYVLKGAHVTRRNNTNALVTVHFNTPVWRARLVPSGNDVLFVVDLRAATTPTFKIQEGADKTATLTIDFPKGDFTNAPPPAETPTEKSPAPKRPRGKGKGQGKGQAPAQEPAAPSGGTSDDKGGTGPTP